VLDCRLCGLPSTVFAAGVDRPHVDDRHIYSHVVEELDRKAAEATAAVFFPDPAADEHD
jgi:hypothetical protein